MAFVPQPWFVPWTMYHYGLGPRPPKPAHLTVKEFPGVFAEWKKCDDWMAWITAGKPKPRPKVWTTVPKWAWDVRAGLQAQGHIIITKPTTETFPMVKSKTAGKNGVYFYVYQNAQIGESEVIRLCKKYNLWVALLVHELGRAPEPSFDTDAQRQRLQGEGITVVASGWLDSAYDLDQQVQAAVHYSQGFDEYMLNAEASFAYVPGQPIDGFQAMGELAPKLRTAFGPTMPFSLSCMWGQSTWLRPLLKAGLSAVRSQDYLNEYPHMTPAGAITRLRQPQGDLPNGLPLNVAAEATYGKYAAGMQPLNTWTPQDDAAKALGMKGRSVWAAEFMDEADYIWLGPR